MDRIEINGTWYVKEDNDEHDSYENKPLEIINYSCKVYEDDYVLLRAEYDELDRLEFVCFMNKNESERREETWDNELFLMGLRDGNKESIRGLKDAGYGEYIENTVIKFIKQIYE